MFLSTFDPFRSIDRATTWSAAPGMPMDAVRHDDEVEIRLDVPGVPRDGVDITVERNVVTIVAERPALATDGASVLAHERRSGAVRRQLSLADSLDGSNLSAELADGVLVIRIPVSERAKAQKVEVTVGSSAPALEATSSEG